MHLAELKLRDFRNYGRLDVAFQPGFHLLLGDNAQGKTNLLEAIYLLATLRSFRGVGGAQMIQHGHKGYFVGATAVSQGEHRIKLYWSATVRKLTLEGRPVRRLTDYLGVVRAVVFCTEDLQLIKGTGRTRRRFLDLLLSQTQPGYLPLLQRYARALRARNVLLRQPGHDEAALESFSAELVQSGNQLMAHRRELLPRLSPLVQAACHRIAPEAEELTLEYRSAVRENFAVELAQSRRRERGLGITVVGPHRDDLQLQLNGRSAVQFGSEGQKRTVAIALKMAQAEFVRLALSTPPLLLIDDVMGELDVRRRSGFLPLLEETHRGRGQVFMTCTEENWPRDLGGELHRWSVAEGTVRRAAGSV